MQKNHKDLLSYFAAVVHHHKQYTGIQSQQRTSYASEIDIFLSYIENHENIRLDRSIVKIFMRIFSMQNRSQKDRMIKTLQYMSKLAESLGWDDNQMDMLEPHKKYILKIQRVPMSPCAAPIVLAERIAS